MRALSIRKPYAEYILRGIRPIDFRSRPHELRRFRRRRAAQPGIRSGRLSLLLIAATER
jgi:hypothetical protein